MVISCSLGSFRWFGLHRNFWIQNWSIYPEKSPNHWCGLTQGTSEVNFDMYFVTLITGLQNLFSLNSCYSECTSDFWIFLTLILIKHLPVNYMKKIKRCLLLSPFYFYILRRSTDVFCIYPKEGEKLVNISVSVNARMPI